MPVKLEVIFDPAHKAFVNRQLHCPLCAVAQLVNDHPFIWMLESSSLMEVMCMVFLSCMGKSNIDRVW